MRHLITFGLVATALALYTLGAEKSSAALMLAGACFELASWKRMRSHKKL